LPTTTAKGNERYDNRQQRSRRAAAELQATVADMQEQVTHLFSLHGPARWKHILKQRKENALAAGTKLPFRTNLPHEVYRPKDHEK
jgi:hypothetical protein